MFKRLGIMMVISWVTKGSVQFSRFPLNKTPVSSFSVDAV